MAIDKEEISAEKIYEGPRRHGHRVTRKVVAVTPHTGYATMVRFEETVPSTTAPAREITLKSFASWALREVTA